jgi:biotin-dependent carboxylase-like uncharacterized protein
VTGVEVVRAGALTTVQDRGRPGLAHLGVPRSGALDQPAHDLANSLVGNDPDAATLEITATGCTLRALQPLVVAVTGAPSPVFVGGIAAPHGSPIRLAVGQVIDVREPTSGFRAYVSIRGGIDVKPILGSRSTDQLSGLGPPPLRSGDLIAVGGEPGTPQPVFAARHALADIPASLTVTVIPGPRTQWFAVDALRTLSDAPYVVTHRSNRVGLRLHGEPLSRSREDELPSEGMVSGAIQIPADGQPVIFLADHPTTGGYPVVAVVHPDHLPALAQAAPGTTVRFART